MGADDRLEQLTKQLSWQSSGPVNIVASELTQRMRTAASALIAALQWAADERPLITLLLSAQVGYLVGRRGRRYARH